jgi:hypothetical protein
MSLIFDSFSSRQQADQFVAAVKTETGLEAKVFDTVDEAQEHDPIPATLAAPVVHIDRPQLMEERGEAIEHHIEDMVGEYGGRFVGA